MMARKSDSWSGNRSNRSANRSVNKSAVSYFVALCLVATSVFVVTLPTTTHAQATGAAVESDRPSSGGPRRQLATIIYSGLGGAVLGLSTLSFYGRPQDKLSNIAVGFAVGVIAGTIAVTYSAATNPDEFYGLQNDSSRGRLSPLTNREILGPENEKTVLATRSFGIAAESSAVSFELPVISF